MTRTVPAAAVRVLQDALAEANEAGITDPAATAQHAASALTAHGWHVTAQPDHLTNHLTTHPTEPR